jgi:hypothetical protein
VATPDADDVQSNGVIQDSFDNVIAPLLATTILADESQRLEDERSSRYGGSSSVKNPVNPFPFVGSAPVISPASSVSGSIVGGTYIDRSTGLTPPPDVTRGGNSYLPAGRRDRVGQHGSSAPNKLNRVNLSAHTGQNLVRTKSSRSGSDLSDV